MQDHFGSDFMTIEDEDGTEYELEVLTSLQIDGITYLAVIPAGAENAEDMQVSILKTITEDGEDILCAIEDDDELERVYQQVIDSLYEDEED